MKLINMERLKRRLKLCSPLASIVLLTQCDQADSDSGADSQESGKAESSADLSTRPPAANASQTSLQLESVTTGDGEVQFPSAQPLSNETTPQLDWPSPWEQKMSELNQSMKTAIESGDTQSLIQNFNTAVQLQGESLSSSSTVIGELMPKLGGHLEVARSLIDSMDASQMMPAISAHGIALSIEDKVERRRWVQSLANAKVRREVLQMLGLQTE
jgi:hypothetical protein